MKKKIIKMTFKEFWEQEEQKATDKRAMKGEKELLLEILRDRGFSENEINNMKMGKVWKICEPVLWGKIDRQMKATELSLSKVSKEFISTSKSLEALWKIPEKRRLLVTDRGLRRDILRVAAEMDDLERSLFQLEETALQGLGELERKAKKEKGENR
ncbi:MAG: hypothetical protein NWE90_08590 [Candidatus Bathyarchaeota archaeon]|nr:hypothetical protein [Candidatus Bathyarchaeota archaeon]